uniref:GumC family protein n=1 Tax=Pedobacter schmidteae TaxID=2201271 RepID=UPI000EB2DF4C|nr:Wzz/FepE/Etk N-terminal domain-containing protein [Pedobacter schmidteae]
MDIKAFLKTLNKYKWILIFVPVVAAVITFFLVKNLPNQYSSEAQIATGLIDQSKQVASGNQNNDFFKISQQFSNIIERMKMRKMISILSYNLILHDLENPKESFKPYSKKVDSLSSAEKSEVIALYRQKLLNKEVITIGDNKGKYKLYDIIGSMKYHKEDIEKKLNVYRPENSDFINVDYVSENPDLSAFVVNVLSIEFIRNYGQDVNVNQSNSIALLDSLLKKKESAMNQKNASLKEFKMKNGVLNLDKQSEIVYTQISENEERKAQALRDIQSNQRAIADIEAKLSGRGETFSGGNSGVDNREIVNLKSQLKIANSNYIDGGFKPGDKLKVDSLTRLVDRLSIRISDNNVTDPQASKQALIQQKLALETVVSQARGSIASIDKELAILKGKYNTMVPFDAGIQNYERDAELATKDYMTALDTYNQTRTEQNISLKLQIAQVGLPGVALPSKGILYVALAGISSFFICFTILLISFLLDNTIHTSKQLASATQSPVLGNLNFVQSDDMTVKKIWNDESDNVNYHLYRDLLRSLRFEISSAMEKDDSKILGITSLIGGEGKSFIASSLAYAFAMIGKKVLLIGGDTMPGAKSSTKELTTPQNFETFLIKKEIMTEDRITVLNKNVNNNSLLEIQSIKSLRAGFEVLSKEFDIIIIDINSLSDLNTAKEWLLFVEKKIAVFEAGKVIGDRDRELIEYIKAQPEFMGWVLNKTKLNKIRKNKAA